MTITELTDHALSQVIHPQLSIPLSELGIKVTINEMTHPARIELRFPFPIESVKTELFTALTAYLPIHVASLYLNTFVSPHLTQLSGQGLRGIKNTIAIASGKGGVGKSTVTLNLAAALAKEGAKVGILDADIYGPSIPLMLGSTDDIIIDNDHYLPAEKHGIKAMSMGYLTQSDQALIWRGPMLAKSLMHLINVTHWGELDYLFIDLPPGTGDIQLSLVQKIPLTGAVIVTTPQQIATLDAEKAIAMFERTGIHCIGLIENMALHTCSACGHEEALFGTGGALALATKHHLPLLGQLPLNGLIREDGDNGTPSALNKNEAIATPFQKAALSCVFYLSQRPLNWADKFPKIVVE